MLTSKLQGGRPRRVPRKPQPDPSTAHVPPRHRAWFNLTSLGNREDPSMAPTGFEIPEVCQALSEALRRSSAPRSLDNASPLLDPYWTPDFQQQPKATQHSQRKPFCILPRQRPILKTQETGRDSQEKPRFVCDRYPAYRPTHRQNGAGDPFASAPARPASDSPVRFAITSLVHPRTVRGRSVRDQSPYRIGTVGPFCCQVSGSIVQVRRSL